MEQQTLELLRALQSSERDGGAFTHIRALLPPERTRLAAAEDRATLADISELLEVWADSAPKELAAAATAEAAQIADEDLEQAERAAQLYLLSLERNPTELEPLRKLDALLCRRGEHARLEAVLALQAEALRTIPDAQPAAIAGIFRRLGQLRTEQGKDLGAAIDAYECALDLAVDMDIVRELADLYGKRGAAGDDAQAADLYCMLAEVVGADDGAPMLERALDQAPSHDAALDLLETFVPAAEQASKLKARWSAYIKHSDNERGVNKRRALLAQVHAAQGEHREAIICLGPLVEKGDPEALRMQTTLLASMQEQAPRESGPDSGPRKSGNGAVPRPATLVGFRVPAPDVAPKESSSAKEPKGGKDKLETRPLRVRSARSGETLVGFRLPSPGAETVAEQAAKPAPSAPAAKPAKPDRAVSRSATSPAAAGSRAVADQPAARHPVDPRPPSAGKAAPRSSATASRVASQPPAATAALAKAAALKAGRASATAVAVAAPRAAPAPVARASRPQLVSASSALPLAPQNPQASSPPVVATPYATLPNPDPDLSAISMRTAGVLQDRRLWIAGGAAALLLAILALAFGSGSKHSPTTAATRGDAVAPRPSAEPVAMPTPAVAPTPTPPPTPSPVAVAPPTAAKKSGRAAPVGHLVPGRAHVTGGGLSSEQIALVLEDSLPVIEHCYSEALEDKPRLQGRAVFGWTIEKTGRPARVRTLSGTLKDDALQQCSIDVIRKARFPKPKKKTSDITWPLDYKTKKS